MNKDEIRCRVLKVVESEVFMGKLPPIDDNELLGEEGAGIDSLNFLKLLTALEKEFGNKIEDEYWDYYSLKTLNSIVEYFYEHAV